MCYLQRYDKLGNKACPLKKELAKLRLSEEKSTFAHGLKWIDYIKKSGCECVYCELNFQVKNKKNALYHRDIYKHYT